MSVTTFNSLADAAGRVTRVLFNPAREAIAGIELRTQQNALVYALPIAGSSQSGFQITFRRLDLSNPQNNQPDTGAVVYRITANKSPAITPGEGSLTFRYAVAAQVYQPQHGAPALPKFDAITVDVILSAPGDVPSKGWVDFDLQFGYPSQIVAGDPDFAWETVVSYPQVTLPSAAGTEYTLLSPTGVAGRLDAMQQWQVQTWPEGITLPVQFTALYRLSTNGARPVAQGVAFAATDEVGHEKRLTLPACTDAIWLSLNLVCPIHLKQGKYVRPRAFKLSAGDAHGYGGAQTRFRLCAFQVQGAVDGAPVDWHDVASLYRQWVRAPTRSGAR